MTLSILGSVAFDTLYTPEGTREKIPGGSAFYSSIAASYFTKPYLISKVGGDYPDAYFTILHDHKINTENIQIDKNQKTFHWIGSYLKNINVAETIETNVGVLANFIPELNSEAKAANICFCANNDPISQRLALEQSKATIKALDTMNLWINIMKSELESTLTLIDILFINDTEIKMLTNEYTLIGAVKKIQKLYPKISYIVLKKGEYSSSIYGKLENEIFTSGAFPLELVKDPTGAGDSFAGGFLGYLEDKAMSWQALKEALLFGTATASFTVEEFGPDALLNTSKTKINQRYLDLKNQLSI
ncbi:MAG: PfkB family carbohydrate kinase [Candidatus Margulisbacteria bacterium]|nr:PfkB family carbohydrate kinase [Candidatus Margulisiibacteriota bacterium]